jgi:hypothetical protein
VYPVHQRLGSEPQLSSSFLFQPFLQTILSLIQ